jgi:hypothetical protein
MSEAGFYRRDSDLGELLFAPNAVYGPEFTLLAEQHAEYQYPVDGWVWFESLETAALGLTEQQVDQAFVEAATI